MTYCIGWKTKDAVFLIADSAVTSSAPINETHTTTSFGEKHAWVGKESVQEMAVKVISIMNTVFTFAGDSTLGYSIAKTLRLALENGQSPKTALRDAIGSNVFPASNKSVSVLHGYYENGRPFLTSFNKQKNGQFENHDDIVQIGSISEKYRNLSEGALNALNQEFAKKASPKRLMSFVLTLVQSYGIRSYLIEKNVGGIFSGIYADATGVNWHSDTLYVIHDTAFKHKECVASIVRDNVLVVRSMFTYEERYFATDLGEGLSLPHWKNKNEKALQEFFNTCRFAYIVFLNNQYPHAVIVEMNHELEHKHFAIEMRNKKAVIFRCAEFFNAMATTARTLSHGDIYIEFEAYRLPI